MAAILAPVATLASRVMSPKLRNMIQMPMRLKQNQMTAAVKSKNLMGNLIRTSTLQLKNPRGSVSVWMLSPKLLSVILIRMTMSVGFLTVTSCSGTVVGRLQASTHSMGAGFVMEQLHVSPDNYQGENARIMAKSMHDAKTEVTPKYNARATSDFRFKTVRHCRFVCNGMHCI
jgi:hypothetical protein